MIRIRPATVTDTDALATVMIEATVTTFQGIVPEQCLSWISHAESSASWRRTLTAGGIGAGDCLLVAEERAGEVVAFALGIVRRDAPDYQGELRVISVLPTYQGRGIGRQLVRAVAGHLARHDVHSLLVRVITTNPNRMFYERLGARYLRDEPYDWNGVPMAEAVYGWLDTAPLIRA